MFLEVRLIIAKQWQACTIRALAPPLFSSVTRQTRRSPGMSDCYVLSCRTAPPPWSDTGYSVSAIQMDNFCSFCHLQKAIESLNTCGHPAILISYQTYMRLSHCSGGAAICILQHHSCKKETAATIAPAARTGLGGRKGEATSDLEGILFGGIQPTRELLSVVCFPIHCSRSSARTGMCHGRNVRRVFRSI